MTRKDILSIIANDAWMMDVLKAAKQLNLPGWWIGGGFVRNKVWDILHEFQTRTPLNDIDLIYFDPINTEESAEKEYEKRLKKVVNAPWSVKNQARMQKVKHDKPYKNAVDGMSHWVETATCIGVRVDDNNILHLAAPHEIEDLVNLVVRPVKGQEDTFEERLREKNWLRQWPKLIVMQS